MAYVLPHRCSRTRSLCERHATRAALELVRDGGARLASSPGGAVSRPRLAGNHEEIFVRSTRTTRVILLATALALLAVVSLPLASVAQTSPVSSSLLVKLIDGLAPDQQAEIIARNGGIEISSIPALRLHVIQVAPADLPQVLAKYQADPQVVNAEENKTRQSQAFPTDPLYSNQWSLPKIGWDLVFGTVTPTGSAIVAILDTGVDAQHPDLAGNVIPGISILDGSSGTTAPSGHGTRVAGSASSQMRPTEGNSGGAYAGVRIMPVTVLDANG